MTSTTRREGSCAVGLLFASRMNAELSYFISVEAVKEVIEEVTGGGQGREMIWPTKID